MSTDHIPGPPPATDTVADMPVESIDTLLLAVARGNQHAFVALQGRMAGLVHLNVHRVLHDAARSETVTRETFADVQHDAIHFDPRRDSAQTWLLTRAHQHATEGLHADTTTHNPHTDPRTPMSHP